MQSLGRYRWKAQSESKGTVLLTHFVEFIIELEGDLKNESKEPSLPTHLDKKLKEKRK